MATVSISPQITDPHCQQIASERAKKWETFLNAQGSKGEFIIVHGHFRPCAGAHGLQYDERFWIVTEPRGCTIFTTIRGNPSDNISAGSKGKAPTRYPGSGHCICGAGH